MYTFRHFLFDLSQIIDEQGFGLFIRRTTRCKLQKQKLVNDSPRVAQ